MADARSATLLLRKTFGGTPDPLLYSRRFGLDASMLANGEAPDLSP
jgi:hypothetical protein